MNVILIIVLLLAFMLLGYVTAFVFSFIDDIFVEDDLVIFVVLFWPIALAIFIVWVIAVIVPKWIIEKLKEGGKK